MSCEITSSIEDCKINTKLNQTKTGPHRNAPTLGNGDKVDMIGCREDMFVGGECYIDRIIPPDHIIDP